MNNSHSSPSGRQRGDGAPGGLMSAGLLNKFAWLKAVYAAPRKIGFTDGEKAVLAYVAVFSVLAGHDTFCVRQSTLAGHCGTSQRTVNAAIVRAKSLGYLAVSRERERGVGRNGADELRLTAPDLSEDTSLDYLSEDTSLQSDLSEDTSLQSPESDVKQMRDLSEADAHSDVKQMRELSEAASALISTNGTPTSSLTSSLTRSLREEASPRPLAQARTGPPHPKNQPPPKNKEDLSSLSPLARRRIQEARANLDQAQRQNRQEGDGR
jgi:hypothetical protein